MKEFKFKYKNWKGITSERKIDIYSINIYWGTVEWHKDKQWLLKAYDIDKQDYRHFAIKDFVNEIELLKLLSLIQ